MKTFATLLAAAALAAPALAQTPKHAAVDAQEAPVTASLNNQVAASNVAIQEGNASREGQYQADRLAYMQALHAYDVKVAATDNRYERQQMAYADAMAAWRYQVWACKQGRQKACNAPTPDPADYFYAY